MLICTVVYVFLYVMCNILIIEQRKGIICFYCMPIIIYIAFSASWISLLAPPLVLLVHNMWAKTKRAPEDCRYYVQNKTLMRN